MAYGAGGLISPEAYQRPALGGLAQSMLGRNVPVNPYAQTPTGQAAIGAGGLGALAMQQAGGPNRNQIMQQRLAAAAPAVRPVSTAPATPGSMFSGLPGLAAQSPMNGLNAMFSPGAAAASPGMMWNAMAAQMPPAPVTQMGMRDAPPTLNSMFGAPTTRVPSPVAPAPPPGPVAAPAPLPTRPTY